MSGASCWHTWQGPNKAAGRLSDDSNGSSLGDLLVAPHSWAGVGAFISRRWPPKIQGHKLCPILDYTKHFLKWWFAYKFQLGFARKNTCHLRIRGLFVKQSTKSWFSVFQNFTSNRSITVYSKWVRYYETMSKVFKDFSNDDSRELDFTRKCTRHPSIRGFFIL
jgi:hypothetical protein